MRKLSNKQRVYNLFKWGETHYFSDISFELDMDIEEVVKICRQLVKEKKIFVQDEKVRR